MSLINTLVMFTSLAGGIDKLINDVLEEEKLNKSSIKRLPRKLKKKLKKQIQYKV